MSRMLKLHPTLFKESLLNNPASNEVINNLKFFQTTKEFLKDKNSCTICLAKFDIDEEVSKLSCEHSFHFSCIHFWLSKVKKNHYVF